MAALALEAIDAWEGDTGVLISWEPSPGTLTKVREAAPSAVPPSYQQAQHLRTYREYSARGTQMARLNVPAWNIAGKCDIGAMTYAINAYLRRHDTYHSRFEFTDAGHIVRRVIGNPGDINLVPVELGEMTPRDWQAHVLATPSPLQWDCFRFGVIQRANHFTVYVCIDHLHADAMFMCAVFVEIHMMYLALARGGAPLRLAKTGSYLDYCVRQHHYASGLTITSPEVRAWIDFTKHNGGTLPSFPLPLGDAPSTSTGALLTAELMDAQQSRRFDATCAESNARFTGGLFACAALAERELTGTEDYYVITPTTTRRTPADFMTTGWFTGVVPIAVHLDGLTFDDVACAAQLSFDSGAKLAHVPFDRVLELAAIEHGVEKPRCSVPMLSYLEAGVPPLVPAVVSQWAELHGRVFSDVGAAHQLGMWVNRSEDGTTITVAFPDNPVARESVVRYVDALKFTCRRVAQGRITVRRPVPTPAVVTACSAFDAAAS